MKQDEIQPNQESTPTQTPTPVPEGTSFETQSVAETSAQPVTPAATPITPTTPVSDLTAAQPAPVTPQQVSTDPGKTLSIVGLILAFIISLVGLIVSIVAFRKSKKAGVTNGIAVAGIIVGSIITLAWAAIISIGIAVTVTVVNDVLDRCETTNASEVVIEGQRFSCPGA